MTWDSYSTRVLREADDIIDTATCMLISTRDVLKILARNTVDEALSDQIAMLEEAIEVGRSDHTRIEETIANRLPDERPDMPIVCNTVRL